MKRWCILNSKILFMLTFFVAFCFFVSAVSASSIYFSQCANGAAPNTDCSVGWVAGMLQSSNSHYHEDEVVPQRIVLSGPLGTGSVTISYDTKNGGVHAYDSLATWNYTVKAADPCQGFSDVCSKDQSTFAIPDDPTNVSPSGTGTGIPVVTNLTSAHMIPIGSGRVIVMYGGIITDVSVPTHTNPLGDVDAATVTITYNVTNPDGQIMILFGAHLAPSVLVRGWGSGLGASSINGNFQVKLGSGGSRTNQVATGTILPIPGNITIKKVTDPISDPTNTSFGFTIDGRIYSSKSFSLNSGNSTIYNVESGVYIFTEVNPSSIFAFKSIECSNDPGSNVTITNDTRSVSIRLGSAGSVNCTFTNKLLLPNLVIVKHVINDNGGTKVAGDFSITVTGTNVQPSATFPGSESGTAVTLDAGAYSVSETELNGYAASYSADCSGSVNYGDSKTCTITNDDQSGTLIVKKVIVNDNGGAKTAQDFSFSVNGGDAIAFEPNGQNNLTVNSGNYTIIEPSVSGYTTTYDNCDKIVIPNGGSATCTITNDDIPGKIKIIKNSIGGDDTFNFTIDGPNLSTASITTSEGIGDVELTVDAGIYSVSESGIPSEWDMTSTNCTSSFNVPNDGTVTCTFENTKRATLTVIKNVVNNYGGTATASDFSLHVKGNDIDVLGSPASGSEAGTQYALTPGTYVVSEDSLTGYSQTGITGDCASDGSITLNAGDNMICTVTNGDIQPQLTVTKIVINDNGGAKQVSDFPLFVNDGSVISGQQNGFNAGNYTVRETSDSNYNETITGDCASDGTIILNVGDVKSCTITNDDIPGTLIVIKHVINGDNGTAIASDFNMIITGTNMSPVSVPGTESPGTNVTMNAGSYAVDENGPSGYNATFSSDCYGVISIGETKTCTITNDDIQNYSQEPEAFGRLTVIKHINGGNSSAQDFTMFVTGTNVSNSSFAGNENGATVTLDAGSYIVDEAGPNGYVPFISSNCFGNISSGQTKTCTITNNYQGGNVSTTPTLEIIKHVINDDSGSAVASNFTITVNGNNLSLNDFPGSETGTMLTIGAGIYSVDESGPSGYDPSFSSTCSGTISDGQFKTCTIINDDKSGSISNSPILFVIKHVINDNGGNNVASNFTMNVSGTNVNGTESSILSFAGSESGVTITLDADNYNVSEDELPGYAAALSSNCVGSISDGQLKTCTIINDDVQPYLTIIKQVTNDNGGSLGVNDFSLFIDNTSVTSGVINTVYAGTHIVSETQQSGYTLTGIGGDCNSDGTIILSPGENKTCTITNNDIAPQNQPVGGGSGGGGGGGGSSGTTGATGGTNKTVQSGQTGGSVNQTCVENWSCSNWTTCQNGVQTRTCTDLNNCGTTLSKPNETQSCSVEQGVTTPTAPTGFFLGLMPLDWLVGIISAIIAGVAGAIFLIIRRRKNKSLTT